MIQPSRGTAQSCRSSSTRQRSSQTARPGGSSGAGGRGPGAGSRAAALGLGRWPHASLAEQRRPAPPAPLRSGLGRCLRVSAGAMPASVSGERESALSERRKPLSWSLLSPPSCKRGLQGLTVGWMQKAPS